MSPPAASGLPGAARKVRKRCVFYFSGFDPKGASRYHALYRDEALRQSRVSGVPMDVGPRQKTAQGNAFWQVTAQTADGVVETHFEFLRWDDIVRQHWPANQGRMLWNFVAAAWLYLRTGAAWRMLKLAWPPVVAMFSAFLLLVAVVLGTPLLAVWIFLSAAPFFGPWAATAAVAAFAALWVQSARMLERKYSMLWLMRSSAFTVQHATGRVPQLDARLDLHASNILGRIKAAQDDEVLLVGHSSGTMMAASALAMVLRRLPAGAAPTPVVSLLTLGHCMPMLGCLPQAQAFRDDLAVLAGAPGFDWVDFTAPSDGCCFPLVDPLASCCLTDARPGPDRPKLLSPRFAEMFDAETYRELRRDKFRVHFQYLMATAKPVAYDYFAITAGAQTLAGRFSSCPGVSGYTRFQIFRR